MSVNKHKQTICDITKIILDDGVTLYPGFVEIKDGKIYRHYSDDPRNQNHNIKPWELKNRVEFRRVEEIEGIKVYKGIKNGLHFIDLDVYDKFVERIKTTKKKISIKKK